MAGLDTTATVSANVTSAARTSAIITIKVFIFISPFGKPTRPLLNGRCHYDNDYQGDVHYRVEYLVRVHGIFSFLFFRP